MPTMNGRMFIRVAATNGCDGCQRHNQVSGLYLPACKAGVWDCRLEENDYGEAVARYIWVDKLKHAVQILES